MVLFTAILMLCAALFLLRSEWEKLQLTAEHYEIRTKKLKKGERYRIVFFSDLHRYFPAKCDQEKILKAMEAENPDAVVIGGDMLCVSKKNGTVTDTGTALSLIRRIAEKYPVFYGEGNHETRLQENSPEEYADYVTELLSCGVRYLSDTAVPLSEHICIAGASLDGKYYRKLSPGFGKKVPLDPGYFEAKSLFRDSAAVNIMLVHSPLYLEEAAKAGADLVLSGHMHGGTIRLPGGCGLMTPQFQFLEKRCSGLHRCGDTAMIVTRGLGTHSVRIRFNNLPELSVADIEGYDGETDL